LLGERKKNEGSNSHRKAVLDEQRYKATLMTPHCKTLAILDAND